MRRQIRRCKVQRNVNFISKNDLGSDLLVSSLVEDGLDWYQVGQAGQDLLRLGTLVVG